MPVVAPVNPSGLDSQPVAARPQGTAQYGLWRGVGCTILCDPGPFDFSLALKAAKTSSLGCRSLRIERFGDGGLLTRNH